MLTSPASLHSRFADLPIGIALPGIALLISVTFLYIVSQLIYNAFLHPLREYPGPVLARATHLTWHVQSMKGRFPLWLHELHEQYGPVVRYGPDRLSTIQPEAWKEVYGHHVPQWPKDPYFFGPDPFGEPVGIIRADDRSHARQRKLVAHAFSDKALGEQESILKNYVSLLVEKVEQEAKKYHGKVDLVAWFNFTTFDVMAELTFGESLNQVAGSMYSPWVKSIFGHVRAIQLIGLYMQWQPFTKLLMWFMPSKILTERKEVARFAAEKVEHRLNSEVERPDIWSYILRYSNDEELKSKGLAHNEMLSNGSSFMAAGTETTATLLSGFFYYLLSDKARHERLVKEIRDAFSTFEEMTMPRLAELRYLQACLSEALRLYPPVSPGIPRMAPKDGAKLGNGFVPKGTRVQVTQYAAYHSSYNFKDPHSFVPERWMPEGQANYGSDKKDVVQPFSFGPRNCIGKNLAYHEMRFISAALLWHYDLELCPESRNWIDQEIYLFWVKPPLQVCVKVALH